jgi:DNA-directed RNA polymerase subunit L
VAEELQISVERAEPNRLTLRLRGEDHTLLNLIVDELNRDEHVAFAAYRQEHPLTDEYVLTVVTDGGESALEALKAAVARAKTVFEKLLREWREKAMS